MVARPGRHRSLQLAMPRTAKTTLGRCRRLPAAIETRSTAHGLTTTLVSDSDAGHRTILPGEPAVTGGIRMRRGGTENADRNLGTAAWAQIKSLLRAGR